MFSSIHRDGNKRMLKTAHKLLDEADVIISYNGKKFDLPTLNKEFIKVGLKPPSPYKQIDLLRTARSEFRFTSNKLDYVAKFLGLEGKLQHKGHLLWKECMNGNDEAWATMEEYNKQDVSQLEEVYNILLPWIKHHPNTGLYNNTSSDAKCPTCGGTHLIRRGYSYTALSKFQRFQCKDCGAWNRDNVNLIERGSVVIREA